MTVPWYLVPGTRHQGYWYLYSKYYQILCTQVALLILPMHRQTYNSLYEHQLLVDYLVPVHGTDRNVRMFLQPDAYRHVCAKKAAPRVWPNFVFCLQRTPTRRPAFDVTNDGCIRIREGGTYYVCLTAQLFCASLFACHLSLFLACSTEAAFSD